MKLRRGARCGLVVLLVHACLPWVGYVMACKTKRRSDDAKAHQLRKGHRRWKKRRTRRHTSASPSGSNTRKPMMSRPKSPGARAGGTPSEAAAGHQIDQQLEQLGHHGHEHRAQDAAQDAMPPTMMAARKKMDIDSGKLSA